MIATPSVRGPFCFGPDHPAAVSGGAPAAALVLLATDGLWDQVSDQEAMELVRYPRPIHRSSLCCLPSAGFTLPGSQVLASQQQSLPRSHSECCHELAELARSRGSRDDITVMLVAVRPSPAAGPDFASRAGISLAVGTNAGGGGGGGGPGLGEDDADAMSLEHTHADGDVSEGPVRKQLGF